MTQHPPKPKIEHAGLQWSDHGDRVVAEIHQTGDQLHVIERKVPVKGERETHGYSSRVTNARGWTHNGAYVALAGETREDAMTAVVQQWLDAYGKPVAEVVVRLAGQAQGT